MRASLEKLQCNRSEWQWPLHADPCISLGRALGLRHWVDDPQFQCSAADRCTCRSCGTACPRRGPCLLELPERAEAQRHLQCEGFGELEHVFGDHDVSPMWIPSAVPSSGGGSRAGRVVPPSSSYHVDDRACVAARPGKKTPPSNPLIAKRGFDGGVSGSLTATWARS